MHQDTQRAPSTSQRRALRINEFCEIYGISRATAYKLIRSGKLQTVMFAGRRLVPVDAAEALLRAA